LAAIIRRILTSSSFSRAAACFSTIAFKLQADLPDDGQNLFNFPDHRSGLRAFSLPNRVRVNRNFLKRFNPI
jgi:hypothetical protein